MNYDFPYITHISQVAPVVQGNPFFKIADKGEYIVITYHAMGNEVFPDINCTEDAIKRECRGIIFDKNGHIMSRPFHKFFNMGERVETQNISEQPAYVLEKLDGSMIRPILVNGVIRLASKAGITDVSMQAEYFIADKPEYLEFMQVMMKAGFTPIFEWCSRKQKIVLDYPVDQLVLLAVRCTYTGVYVTHKFLDECRNIPVISKKSTLDLLEVSKQENIEGYVLVYPDGHRVKVKSDWYVTLHRAKDAIRFEKDVVKLILEEKLDDLKPILSKEDLERVNKYVQEFRQGFADAYNNILQQYISLEISTFDERKYVAEKVKTLDKKYHPYMFKQYDGKSLIDCMYEQILKGCSSRNKLDEVRWLFGNATFNEATEDA